MQNSSFAQQLVISNAIDAVYAVCAVCGAKREQRGGLLRFSRLARLRRLFNRCPMCGRWVCDDCFVIDGVGDGRCSECAEKSE